MRDSDRQHPMRYVTARQAQESIRPGLRPETGRCKSATPSGRSKRATRDRQFPKDSEPSVAKVPTGEFHRRFSSSLVIEATISEGAMHYNLGTANTENQACSNQAPWNNSYSPSYTTFDEIRHARTFATEVHCAFGILTGSLVARLLLPEGRGALAAVLFWPQLLAGIGS